MFINSLKIQQQQQSLITILIINKIAQFIKKQTRLLSTTTIQKHKSFKQKRRNKQKQMWQIQKLQKVDNNILIQYSTLQYSTKLTAKKNDKHQN